MKTRWQESLEAAAAAHDAPMPWERGASRQAMIARRKAKADEDRNERAGARRRA